MSTKWGKLAEEIAAEYLKNLGWDIRALNWHNRWCEIDIVAKSTEKKLFRKSIQTIHFVEVKYSKSNFHGPPVERVTNQKLRQMKFAAQHWVSEHEWHGPYQLDVIAMTGKMMDDDIELIENVTL